ncbi:TPA: hypothetical protein DEP34_01500 [Candidatus Uhrbacteria bacterium]|uniref:Phosphate propanoyltransferase n=2 Tax=Candidatus Uhriibacteriota TaxID=1752732 RepID=A0A0G1T6M7_9BACT|nr:MAG: Phosphate propanoyltransferase [Candidatus Uhrbacteria bacterium GW2011_GWF2_46_218]KKU41030.1 MAG: Phosphate propanoyltransferase [Candidatus Uhrbacteria bacterium GW2011_GWE2_46_68]HBK33715.1 hypothetical protein [Candidatus Uhrbacteria bacterium]HCB19044.1 hypothetical protein [Candidatus Uhrbacteria bacterium]
MTPIPLEIVYRHIHLSSKDRQMLFGDFPWTKQSSTKHQGQFFSGDCVLVKGGKGKELFVPVLGPERQKTQVELTATDAMALGIKAPSRLSGDMGRAGVVALEGAAGSIKKLACAILPIRHLHLSEKRAKQFGFHHSDVISLVTTSSPSRVIPYVVVRVHPSFHPVLHLTIDEAILYGLHSSDTFQPL